MPCIDCGDPATVGLLCRWCWNEMSKHQRGLRAESVRATREYLAIPASPSPAPDLDWYDEHAYTESEMVA